MVRMARSEAFHLIITIVMMIQLTRNPGSNKVADQVYHPSQTNALVARQLTTHITDIDIYENHKPEEKW